MPKIIAMQPINQQLVDLLRHQGYIVIDMYQAHRQRETIDAYLYTTYHPDAFSTYHSVAEAADIILGNTEEVSSLPNTIMLNITNMHPEQILMKLNQRFQEKRQHVDSFT